MKRIVATLLLACGFAQHGMAASPADSAAPPVAPIPVERQVKTAHASCQATNILTAGMQPDIWASPVFEFSYLEGLFMYRLNELGTAFTEAVARQGGSGDINCGPGTSRAELEKSLAETRKNLSRKFLGVASAFKYHDVAWTPAPWDAAVALNTPAVQPQFVHCDATLESMTLASLIFTEGMPTDDAQHVAELNRFSVQFKRDVADVRLPGSYGGCHESNSQREAQHKHDELRRVSTRNGKLVDVNWKPTRADAALPGAADAATSIAGSHMKLTAFKPVIVDPKSLDIRLVLPVVYGFCQRHGQSGREVQQLMTPVFSVQNAEGELTTVLAQRYAAEFAMATDPRKKWKHASEYCSLARSHTEIEVTRQDRLAYYGLPPGNSTRIAPVVTQWLPANAAPAAVPEGPPLSLHLACSALDSDRHTIWYSQIFIPAGTDGAEQFRTVQRLHGEYRKFIMDTQGTQEVSAATCWPSENPAIVTQLTGVMAQQYLQAGYAAWSVDWDPR